MKNIFTLCLTIIIIGCECDEPVPDPISTNCDCLPTSTTNQIIKHTHFTLSYSEMDEQAEWVAYKLTKDMVQGSLSINDDFKSDPLVLTGSASPNDYTYSGYDRGHLAPAADMNFSQIALLESYYMSNISPQLPSFNGGIWKLLEGQVRQWAVENEELCIVTAGILDSIIGKIGINEVTVPGYFYKIILDYKEPDIKAIAFMLPNEKGTMLLSEYAVSIDSVEQLTGIDFFPDLPNSIEIGLESHIEIDKWAFEPRTP
ncbi:MAG: DNA/RNA non-specific endonuclease [Bacteroidetes bacterium]|nr:DNA/RNA non-specific endonuclease [Bacteroidota bacterium]